MSFTPSVPAALFLLLLFSTGLRAQTDRPNILSCATDELHQAQLATNPHLRQTTDRLEAEWAAYARKQRAARKSAPPYILPIVFHIVHDNGAENIADADVVRSLAFTNQSFANTAYYDQGTGVNTQLQFCLAQRTPDNQATNGITRTVSAEWTNMDDAGEDRAMKIATNWSPQDYVNVYVVGEICRLSTGCGTAGYANYPGGHGRPTDGIVVEARWLTGGEAQAALMAHEIGHYLGLRHTFDGGCANDDCLTDGDRVCDTPPDNSRVTVPCSGSVNSCTTDTDSGFATDQDDMFINYMDYGYWRCYSAFTQGQSDRMQFFLGGVRRSLTESPGCLAPCPAPVTASFTGGETTVEAGTTVDFISSSTNGSGLQWLVDGTPEGTATTFSRQFPTEGFYEVELIVDGTPPLCQPVRVRRRVRVVCSLTATFTTGPPVTVGEPTVFTNTSALADRAAWTIDGTPVATTTDLTFTFPGAGLFQVCLEAGNDFCERTTCRRIFAAPPPDTTGSDSGGCTEAFAYSYLLDNDDDTFGQFSVVLPDGGGGYFAAGRIRRVPTVLRLRADGSIVWQQALFPGSDEALVRELILDQDGFLAGVGEGQASANGNGGLSAFAFRMNAADGDLVWGREFSLPQMELSLTTILQPAPTESYTVIGNRNLSGNGRGDGGVILWLDPANGDLLGQPLVYGAQAGVSFERAVYEPGTNQYFVAGFQQQQQSTELLTLRLTATGQPLNVRTYTGELDPDQPLDLEPDASGYAVVAALPRPTGNSPASGTRLFQLAPDGQPTLVADYFRTGALRTLDLEVNDRGYLLYAQVPGATSMLTQLNFGGGIEWARSYLVIQQEGEGHECLYRQANGQLLIAGSLAASGTTLPSLVKLRADGTSVTGCFPSEPTDLEREETETDVQNQQFRLNELDLQTSRFFFEPAFLTFGGQTCVVSCDEVCDDGLDNDEDGLTDCEDPDVAAACCCLPAPAAPPSLDTTVCLPFVFQLTAPSDLRLALTAPDGAAGDTLGGERSWELTEPGEYVLTYVDSCSRLATSVLTLHPRPRPLLDLGADTTVCANAVVTRRAPPGFASYEWSDGTGERDYTASEPGAHWVVVTDSCGGVQADTFRVRIQPTTVIDLGRDTTICPGEVLTFRLSGFTDHQWSASSFIDCTDCPTVRFAPTTDTLLLVAASAGPGCFSSDSLRVRVDRPEGVRTRLELCAGDTLLLNGRPITAPGVYLDTAAVAGNCEVIDTVDVVAAPGSALGLPPSLTITFGDSVRLRPLTDPANLPFLAWRVNDSLVCTGCAEWTLRPEHRTVVTAELPDSAGCGALAQTVITLTDQSPVYVPTAFSPNGDEVNDVFRLFPGPAVEAVLELAVFDRWGNNVYRREFPATREADGDWNGRARSGQPLPIGVYVYYARVRLFNRDELSLAGEVMLVR